MTPPDWLSEYGAVGISAFFGGIANGSRWRDAQGNWVWRRTFIEMGTAVAIAIGLMALAESTHVDLKILCGLGVLAGWLGPRPVADYALRKLGVHS